MESDIVISELLCFVNCKYGTVPIQSLMSTVIGFYDVEDIYEAKKKLNDIAQKCIENPPTHGRRQGDGRKKRECEDLLSMYEALDKAECKLPKFVAEDLNKVPSVKASDFDMCVLVSKMSDLTDVVEQLRLQVSDMRKQAPESTCNQASIMNIGKVSGKNECLQTVVIPSDANVSGNACNVIKNKDDGTFQKDANFKRYQENKKKVADVVKRWENEEWTTVERPKKKKAPPLFGTRMIADGDERNYLKAAKQKRTFHVYVGNLDRGTSDNEVRKYLNDRAVEVMTCELVDSGVEHWDERPSSFHVEIDYAKKDEVMKDTFWDLGVKVRQWFFRSKRRN